MLELGGVLGRKGKFLAGAETLVFGKKCRVASGFRETKFFCRVYLRCAKMFLGKHDVSCLLVSEFRSCACKGDEKQVFG